MRFSAAEQRLVIALAVHIARRLEDIFLNQSRPDDRYRSANYPEAGYFHHVCTSDFEIACGTLWAMDVAMAAYSESMKDLSHEEFQARRHTLEIYQTWPPYFRVLSEPQIRARLASPFPPAAPPLDRIIESFLRLSTQAYGLKPYTVLPTARFTAFSCENPDHDEVLRCFVQTGYATEDGHLYAWTGKIGAAMLLAYAEGWDQYDESQIDMSRIIEQVEQMKTQRKAADYRGESPLEIMYRWNGLTWAKARPGVSYWSFDEAMAMYGLVSDED